MTKKKMIIWAGILIILLLLFRSCGSDGLERDSQFTGTWQRHDAKAYNQRTGVTNQRIFVYNADGTMEIFNRTSAVSTSVDAYTDFSFSFDDGWEKNMHLQNRMDAGTRWFTRNNVMYLMEDGKEVFDYHYLIERDRGNIMLYMVDGPDGKVIDAYVKIK